MAKKKAQSKAKAAKPVTRARQGVGLKADPQAKPDLAKAFQLELQSVPAPPPSSVITLDPDVAPHFPNSRAVNEALRALVRIVRQVKTSA